MEMYFWMSRLAYDIDGRRVEYREGRIERNIEQIGYLKEVENLESLD